jgi:hypothetical protein
MERGRRSYTGGRYSRIGGYRRIDGMGRGRWSWRYSRREGCRRIMEWEGEEGAMLEVF